MKEIDEAELIKVVFSNAQGDKLMEYWDFIYNRRLSFHPQNTPEQTAFNEGVRSFYQGIHNMLNEGK